MSWARAASMSFFTFGTVAMQRGRVPQLAFIRSRTRSAVVLGSTVAGLSSGAGGGFTVAHSVVMSLARAGAIPNAAAATARTTTPDMAAGCFITLSPFAVVDFCSGSVLRIGAQDWCLGLSLTRLSSDPDYHYHSPRFPGQGSYKGR